MTRQEIDNSLNTFFHLSFTIVHSGLSAKEKSDCLSMASNGLYDDTRKALDYQVISRKKFDLIHEWVRLLFTEINFGKVEKFDSYLTNRAKGL